jgi:threonine/homoserine/homoserine lactone efflux protein
MAATIALITLVYCLVLCAFAGAVSSKVKTHKRVARWLERLAGVFLVGFGISLATN